MTQALSLVELTGVNQVDGPVGHSVESLATVVDNRPSEGARRTDGQARSAVESRAALDRALDR